MKLPEYVTVDEVKRVCREIGLRDWSEITDATVSGEEASSILKIVKYPGNGYSSRGLPQGFRG